MKKPLLSLLIIIVCSLTPIHAATIHVTISGVSFTPKEVSINVGDTVVWSGGNNTHTVTPRPGVPEPFCGGTAMTTCSHTFTTPGSFAYLCNFHESSFNMTGVVHVAAVSNSTPPEVVITNPVPQALFAAPATVPVLVSATDGDGTVTSVQVLTNGVAAGTSTTAPFGVTLNNLAPGNYTLTAHATDNQSLTATSAPVTIRVVTRPTLVVHRPDVLSFPPGEAPPLQFSFDTVTGVDYVIEAAAALNIFSPVVTNAGNGGVQQFTQTNPAPDQRFYRLLLQ